MKKMIIAATIVCVAAFAHAASVAWTCAGLNNYAGSSYLFFVEGQNGASEDSVKALLDAGSAVDSYSFGGGTVSATGLANNTAGVGNLAAGTYNAFFVVFDSATPTAGTSKYLIIDKNQSAKLTQSPTATTAKSTFAGNNQSSYANASSNWQSFGSAGPIAPEPTSGLLLLLGMAGLALKRKVA